MNAAILNESIKICNFIGASVNNRMTSEYIPDEFAVLFAEYHKLVTLLYSALNHFGASKGEHQKLSSLADSELLKQLRNDALQEKICEEFKQKEIPHMILKGTETRRFYPEHLMRTSNDIDIYVDPENIVAATKILKSLGLEYVKLNSNGQDFEFKQGNSYVELHISMGGITKAQKRLFAEMATKASVGLTHEDKYIYALFHLYKHFITAGAGVRMFLDVYCVGKAQNIDRNYIKKALEKLDLLRFENTVKRINEVLFESREATTEILELLEFIFENGAYGSEETAKHMKYAGTSANGQRSVKSMVSDLCLDINSMKKRYGILNKCIVLYPFCVVHRAVKGIIFRKKTLSKTVDSAKDIILNREHYSRILKISGIL